MCNKTQKQHSVKKKGELFFKRKVYIEKARSDCYFLHVHVHTLRAVDRPLTEQSILSDPQQSGGASPDK